eukprot:CAMPEP_0116024312 /NCGR_PEP_ID=MMETSP0321-20121206/12231_1 /TAXON_ID=163516 /ORGANISM="Leptocylindrus danicus var. danicus, Strain B650" /LENGTH=406 /DNA_ID=CAMNT_0003495997 /DNA_START=99 /DNA_END=1319 /DNA_ORIENTATION=+
MYRSREDVSHECIECDNEKCGKSNPQKRCSRCRCVYYCDASCQKNHWKEHKPWCKEIKPSDVNKSVGDALPVAESPSTQELRLQCGICLEENESIVNPMFMPGCNHVFCFKCISDYQAFAAMPTEFMDLFSRKENTCPMCRTQVPKVDETLIERALQYGAKANQAGNVEERDRFCDFALDELQKVLDNKPDNLSALFVKSQILLIKDQPEHAVGVIQNMIDIDKQGRENTQMMLDMILEGEKLESMGRYSEAKQIDERLEEFERSGLSLEHIGAGKGGNIDLYILLADAKKCMNDWSGAVEAYRSIGEQTLSSGSAIQKRKMIMGLCHCHFELGEYHQAITLGDLALQINRHFPGVHKYIALSTESIGDVEGAKKIMSRAVLYETPWDKDNVMENLKLLNELISRV